MSAVETPLTLTTRTNQTNNAPPVLEPNSDSMNRIGADVQPEYFFQTSLNGSQSVTESGTPGREDSSIRSSTRSPASSPSRATSATTPSPKGPVRLGKIKESPSNDQSPTLDPLLLQMSTTGKLPHKDNVFAHLEQGSSAHGQVVQGEVITPPKRKGWGGICLEWFKKRVSKPREGTSLVQFNSHEC